MKLPASRLSVLALSALLPLALLLPAFAPQAELADVMGQMKGKLKALTVALAAKDEPASLEVLGAMQGLALEAKGFVPPGTEKLPRDGQAAHVKAYRKELLVLLRQLADLEDEVLDGKWDAATQRATVGLKDLRDAAHEKFQTDG
ncbi:MAG: hypothetical protein FJ296_10580 [Planctomycetes bacterium]|nr:hypothetical protein [Planctomycetota bacterium]